jgi:hypothetical protein
MRPRHDKTADARAEIAPVVLQPALPLRRFHVRTWSAIANVIADQRACCELPGERHITGVFGSPPARRSALNNQTLTDQTRARQMSSISRS